MLKIVAWIRSLGRLQKAGLIMLATLVLYTAVGFLVLPPLFQMMLTRQLAGTLGRQVDIGSVKVNPYTLSLRIRDLNIAEAHPPGTFLSFKELALNIQAASLVKRALIIKELALTGPHLTIIRSGPQQFNFSDLLTGSASWPLEHFALNNIRITDGTIIFRDLPNQETQNITELTLAVPFISNIPSRVGIWVKPHFACRVNGSPFSFTGESKPFAEGRATELNIAVQGINLPRYVGYIPSGVDLDLRSGLLDLDLHFLYGMPMEGPKMEVTGAVTLREVEALDARGDPLLNLPRLQIGIASLAPLAHRLQLGEVRLQAPAVAIRRESDGRFNLPIPQAREGQPAPPPPPAETRKEDGFVVAVEHLEIEGAVVHFTDRALGTPFTTTFRPLRLEVKDYSTAAGNQAAFTLTASAEEEATLSAEGRFSVDPLASTGTLELAGIDLRRYAPYYGEQIRFIVKAGVFRLKTDYQLGWKNEAPQTVLRHLSLALDSVRLRQKEAAEDFLTVEAIRIDETSFDLAARKLAVGTFASRSGHLAMVRQEDGGLNLTDLMPPGEKASQDEPGSWPWDVRIASGTLRDFSLEAQDRTTPEPSHLAIAGLSLTMEDVASAANSRGRLDLSFRVNEQGTATAAGSFGLRPSFADLEVEAQEVALPPFAPYLASVMEATVTGGRVSLAGHLLAGRTNDGKTTLAYQGEATLADFASTYGGQDLLRWARLAVHGIDYGNLPSHLKIREVVFDNPHALVRIAPDGTINLLAALSPPRETAGAPSPTADRTAGKEASGFGPLRIDKAVLHGGMIAMNDEHIHPPFRSQLAGLEGTILGLSSEKATEASVTLQGQVNDVAPLAITGKVSPVGEVFRLDMNADLQGLDMANLNPFARKYIGYTLAKGNLTLSLQYKIAKTQLDSRNTILLDQLTLGERVKSEEALSIPIKLAIELLKNRQGEIKLDIPVSGDLSDPQFHPGSVIWSAVKEIITKAITSPFSLLASLVNWGGGELKYIEFPYGSSRLTPQATAKLANLAEALYERPGLEMDVQGYVAADRDRQALRRQRLQTLLRRQKLRDLVQAGQGDVSLDQVSIGPEEHDKYLIAAYREALSERTGEPVGEVGGIVPRKQMENFLLATIEITKEDLRLLAQQRAVQVRKFMLSQAHIEPNRIFIVTPATLTPEKKEGLRESRAVLEVQ